MQQYLSDDFINDPIRSSYNNHQSDDFNPLLPQNNNGYNFDTNIFIKELNNNKSNDLPIIPYKKANDNDINTYNNDMNRFNDMTQEILEKDREIAEYKNKTTSITREQEGLKEELRKIPILELENKQLREKINDLTKEIYRIRSINSKNENLKKFLKKKKKENKKLKKIIEISQKNDVYNESESDAETDDETDDEIKINMDSEEEVEIVENDSEIYKLKNILVQRFPKYTRKQIDTLFSEMDINDDIKVTKDLLKAIIEFLSS